MGITYERKSKERITEFAEGLANAAAHLTQVVLQMNTNQMDNAVFTWVQRHTDAYDIVTAAAATCLAMMPKQIEAKKQGRPSIYETRMARSEKEAKAKKSRVTATSSPPKKRGRPKKAT
jgi:hypothetical protein